jgi:hypothetical protein
LGFTLSGRPFLAKSKAVRFIVLYGLVSVAGCAPWGSREQEALLDAAGFRARKPETPMQQQLYDAAPSYELFHGVVNGESFYAYKDRARGIAYVGGPTDYGRYEETMHQVRLGRVDHVNKEVTGEKASGWYQMFRGKTGLTGGPLEQSNEEPASR